MPKSEKMALGRALVKHHNHMIKESKEKGKFYRAQQKKVMESVTEVSDIEAVIERADEAHRLYAAVDSPVHLKIDLDSASRASEMTVEERRQQQKKEESLHASSLRIPRRPPWNSKMSTDELDDNERRAFLEWRRSLARLEENDNLVLTPFEKNLDIWRQLWRVLERSDLLVMVVDSRDPLFYRCPDLEVYAREIDKHKRTLLLVNKADLLPLPVREKWANYFHEQGILHLFWSAKAASATLDGKNLDVSTSTESNKQNPDVKIYQREELLERLQFEAEEIVSERNKSKPINTNDEGKHSQQPHGVMVGFVGYPNVGKSSTINALVGEKRTGVTSTPGKTKHFQTLIISEKLTLCDCPGLVFPSFTSSRYDMIASGVLPIDRMTEHRQAVQVVADKVPRSVIEEVYNISLPKPKPYEAQNRPPTSVELLRAYCASRGYVASSGLPDETKAARIILKDYIDGKLSHFALPPAFSDGEEEDSEDSQTGLAEIDEYYSSNDEASENRGNEHYSNLENVLSDLNSFDRDNGLASGNKSVERNKSSKAPHKQHKKPQRKKDRLWRVRDIEGDGMPVVRVFQKPANLGPSNA